MLTDDQRAARELGVERVAGPYFLDARSVELKQAKALLDRAGVPYVDLGWEKGTRALYVPEGSDLSGVFA
jgi:hypothetical protein